MKIAVLGAGMVGRAIAFDLFKSYDTTSFDINQDNLDILQNNYSISTKKSDLSNPENIKDIVKEFDLVIGAVPGFMGFNTVKAVIEAGKNIVDISFFPEDSLILNSIAIEKNVTAIVDFGVAPGMPNFVAGYYANNLKIDNFEYYVGGLPVKRNYPFQYKAPFSPVDVLEEYTRPARFVVNGKEVIKDAMSDAELMEFDEIGTLEAFNTDGLRSLIKTLNIPSMKEKTLRYPGHIEYIKFLKAAGFLSEKKIKVGNSEVSPLYLTSQILFDNWKLQDDDDEFTVMRIILDIDDLDSQYRVKYDLLDRRDKETKISSMSRTTGFACTAAANLILQNKFNQKGLFTPELVPQNDEIFNFVMDYLKHRNINYNYSKINL